MVFLRTLNAAHVPVWNISKPNPASKTKGKYSLFHKMASLEERIAIEEEYEDLEIPTDETLTPEEYTLVLTQLNESLTSRQIMDYFNDQYANINYSLSGANPANKKFFLVFNNKISYEKAKTYQGIIGQVSNEIVTSAFEIDGQPCFKVFAQISPKIIERDNTTTIPSVTELSSEAIQTLFSSQGIELQNISIDTNGSPQFKIPFFKAYVSSKKEWFQMATPYAGQFSTASYSFIPLPQYFWTNDPEVKTAWIINIPKVKSLDLNGIYNLIQRNWKAPPTAIGLPCNPKSNRHWGAAKLFTDNLEYFKAWTDIYIAREFKDNILTTIIKEEDYKAWKKLRKEDKKEWLFNRLSKIIRKRKTTGNSTQTSTTSSGTKRTDRDSDNNSHYRHTKQRSNHDTSI